MTGDTSDQEKRIVIERHSGGVGGFLLGVALGAALALLLAPESGAVTRRKLRRKARRAGEAVQDMAGELVDDVATSFEDARTRVEHTIDAARKAVAERVGPPSRRRSES